MKSCEMEINFPAFGFTPSDELYCFSGIEDLTKCGRQTLKQNVLVGMELIDSDYNRWRIISAQEIEQKGNIISKLFPFKFGKRQIELDAEPMTQVSLVYVQWRTCKHLQIFTLDYYFQREKLQFLEEVSKVRNSSSLAEISEICNLENLEHVDNI